MCWIEGTHPGAPEAQPLRRLFDEDVELFSETHLLFWSVVWAAIELDGDVLFLPEARDLPEHTRALWGAMVERLNHRRFFSVGEGLKTHLQRNLARLAAA
jgi:hypothetical protein